MILKHAPTQQLPSMAVCKMPWQKMRLRLAVLAALPILFCPLLAAHAQISLNIGINMPVFPSLVLVPGSPVYYDPQVNSNYFFYDGEYWMYDDDNWYSSTWYNGPWGLIEPDYVPLFLLRVPVSYYRQPPIYFQGWASNAPPRWGDHWGHDWEQHRSGWNRWDRHAVPAPAPLPTYQRQYSGNNYPRAVAQQQSIRSEKYRYQPHETITKQHFQQQNKSVTARAEPQRTPNPPRSNQQPVLKRASEQTAPSRTNQPPHTQPNQERPNQDRHEPQAAVEQPHQQQRPQPERHEPPSQQPPAQTQRAQPQEHAQKNGAAPQEKERENEGEEHRR